MVKIIIIGRSIHLFAFILSVNCDGDGLGGTVAFVASFLAVPLQPKSKSQ